MTVDELSRKERGHEVRRAPRGLSFPTRVREGLWRSADRLLGSDWFFSLLFFVVAVAVLGLPPGRTRPLDLLVEGQTLRRDVVAREPIRLVDLERTADRRREAAAGVPPVFFLDAEGGARASEALGDVFRRGRLDLESGRTPEGGASLRVAVGEERAVPALRSLVETGFSASVERDLRAIVADTMARPIVGGRAALAGAAAILVVREPGRGEERISDFSAILDLDEARRIAREAVVARASIPAASRQALGDIAAAFVQANLSFDPRATEERRRAAQREVAPVLEAVPAGTMLVRAGETVTAETLARLEVARSARPSRAARAPELAGLLILVGMLAFFLFRYTRYHQRHFRKVRNLHALLVIAILSMLLLARAVFWIVHGAVSDLGPPFDDPRSYAYVVPMAGGAILVALLANGRISMVFSAFTALLFGAMRGFDAYALIWALLVQWAGVYAITTYRERSALLRAGLLAGLAGAAAALAVEGLRGGLGSLAAALYGATLAFAGGALGTGLLVSFALPLFEGLFRVLTDVRLLELSNINNPLLSQFAVKAPGSYNHSLIVGTLAEEAAKSIGANSLFCRVAAFYHDIGKIRKPEYYVENQRGQNPHDRLSPYMSALIISAHVKDGIRLAQEAGLPEQIVDIVPQHHGTRVMGYFYDKARRSADPSLGPVSEADFRYPGPKPQTREAAIFMLSDAVEAAARTVDDPTPGRLGEVVHKVTRAIVLDRQLDECDLTFADLEKIEAAFLRALASMYHHRVDYPGFDFGRGPRGNGRGTSEPPERRGARGPAR